MLLIILFFGVFFSLAWFALTVSDKYNIRDACPYNI